MNENILKLKLYKPELEKAVPKKSLYRKRVSPSSIIAAVILIGAIFLVILKWESIVDILYKPKAIYLKFAAKSTYKPSPPDTMRQRQIADSLAKLVQQKVITALNVIDSIKLSMRWKRGIIDFLKYFPPGLNPKKVYTIDDEFIVIEGTSKTRAYLDTLIDLAVLKGAFINCEIIKTEQTSIGTRYLMRTTKQPVERVWDDNFVSIQPYKRKEVLDRIDSLSRAAGLTGNITPLDEEIHGEDFKRYLLLFHGRGSTSSIVEFLEGIDKLEFYVQIISSGIEFATMNNRLTLLMGLNYLTPKMSTPKGEQTNLQ